MNGGPCAEPHQTYLLLDLIDRLGSSVLPQRVQAATFVLQEVTGERTGFEFGLWKRSAYSFDLQERLDQMVADHLLTIGSNSTLVLSVSLTGREFLARWPRVTRAHRSQSDFAVQAIEGQTLAEIERLTVAIWATREFPDLDREEQAKEILQRCPHVSPTEAWTDLIRVAILEFQHRMTGRPWWVRAWTRIVFLATGNRCWT